MSLGTNHTTYNNMRSLQCLLLAVLFFAYGPTNARAPRGSSLTPDQQAQLSQQQLENASVEIDDNCQPTSATKMNWLVSPKSVQVFFWKGQQYAIERSVKRHTDMKNYRQIENNADAEIAAIEQRKFEALMQANGRKISPEYSQKSRERSGRLDATEARTEQMRDKAFVDWYWRCKAYAAQRLRELE